MNAKQPSFAEKVHHASFIAEKRANAILARLAWMSITPKRILNIHSGTGYLAQSLQECYPQASVVCLDLTLPLLKYTKSKMDHISHQGRNEFICAGASLPMASHVFDMVIIHLMHPHEIAECFRVLKPNGLFMITSFGPDTLQEFPQEAIIPARLDMHDLGDLLLKTGFSDPVMDVESLTVRYQDKQKMQDELQLTSMLHPCPLPDTYSVTYEMIYGHAWGRALPTDHVIKIPIEHIMR